MLLRQQLGWAYATSTFACLHSRSVRQRIDYEAMTARRCSKCGETKTVTAFNRFRDDSSQAGWRYYAWCRACQNQRSREYGTENKARRNARLQAWRATHREAARRHDRRGRLKWKYKLTDAQVDALLVISAQPCRICGENGSMLLDHDHKTGRVRGFLCNRCNLMLGWFEKYQAQVEAHLALPTSSSSSSRRPEEAEPA